MSYIFINIDTFEVYECEEDLWHNAYDFACEDGWVPDGTFFDLAYQISEDLDDVDDYNFDPSANLFGMLLALNDMHKWDGNYFEKRNQVVTDTDLYYMVLSLKCGDFPAAFLEFLDKGSFRICSD